MESLFSLLLFGAFFYLMMRFGCGAHMVHGHRHRHDAGTAAGGVDPVCGMQVGAGSGYSKVHAGERLFFCSRDCLDKFEAEPARYLRPAGKGCEHAA